VRASPSPAPSTSSPAASQGPTSEQLPPQKRIILDDGVYRWDAPGTASLTQTQAVARRYAATLSTEEIPGAELYAANATWDDWGMGRQVRGGKDIQSVYREFAYEAAEHPFLSDEEPGWALSKRSRSYHLLAAPGVAICEGMFQFTNSIDSGSYLALLAVDGDRIAHEEIFAGGSRSVAFLGFGPGPGDTAKVAARVGAAAGAALAIRDWPALQALLARDVLFRDVTNQENVRGQGRVLSWWRTLAPASVVKITNQAPIAGLGWAVVRWTGQPTYTNGYFPKTVFDESRNAATVIEVRDGKVVRMTLHLEPGEGGGGSILQQER
jgi:hypothetical protein